MKIFSEISPPEYDAMGRMKYHPNYHPKHKQPWSYADEKYLIENYAIDGPEAVAAALGRTIGVVMTRAFQLRKEGKMAKWAPAKPKHKRLTPRGATSGKKWRKS